MLLPIVCNSKTVSIWLCIHLSVESRMIRVRELRREDLVKMIGKLLGKKRSACLVSELLSLAKSARFL